MRSGPRLSFLLLHAPVDILYLSDRVQLISIQQVRFCGRGKSASCFALVLASRCWGKQGHHRFGRKQRRAALRAGRRSVAAAIHLWAAIAIIAFISPRVEARLSRLPSGALSRAPDNVGAIILRRATVWVRGGCEGQINSRWADLSRESLEIPPKHVASADWQFCAGACRFPFKKPREARPFSVRALTKSARSRDGDAIDVTYRGGRRRTRHAHTFKNNYVVSHKCLGSTHSRPVLRIPTGAHNCRLDLWIWCALEADGATEPARHNPAEYY